MDELHLPWTEVKAMSAMERKTILYGLALRRRCTVNWDTGEIRPPKTK